MNRVRQILLAAAAVLLALSLQASELVHCIVILKHRTGAGPDVARLGGTIDSRQDEQMVVSVPPAAVGQLRSDPAVLYIEQVDGQKAERDERGLVGVPSEPQAGASAAHRRLTPQPLGSTPKDLGVYSYDGGGNIIAIGTDRYVYDGAQRLVQSSTMGTSESYTYDGFGNMKTRTNRTLPTPDAQTNHEQGYTYDEIGAVVTMPIPEGTYNFTYDAVGQPLGKTFNGANQEYYVYSASDERIGVQRSGWWHWSLRDESGKVLRQFRSSAQTPAAPLLWLEDYVWRDGLLLGSNRPVELGGRRHFHLDHLGTPRLITSDNGAQLISQHDYYPFGDELTPVPQEGPGSSGFDREEPMKFTSHERDFAGGPGAEGTAYLDYMHARYYSPGMGRFLSVDPMLDVKAAAKQPRMWNRYAYVLNNPINATDPTGEDTVMVPVYQMTGQERLRFEITSFGAEEKMAEIRAQAKAGDPLAKSMQSGRAEAGGLGPFDIFVFGWSLKAAQATTPIFRFASEELLREHFEKHGAEFGLRTISEYAQAAARFAASSGERGVVSFTRANGDKVIYRLATNEFGVVARGNIIRTYFSPTAGAAYYANQLLGAMQRLLSGF